MSKKNIKILENKHTAIKLDAIYKKKTAENILDEILRKYYKLKK